MAISLPLQQFSLSVIVFLPVPANTNCLLTAPFCGFAKQLQDQQATTCKVPGRWLARTALSPPVLVRDGKLSASGPMQVAIPDSMINCIASLRRQCEPVKGDSNFESHARGGGLSRGESRLRRWKNGRNTLRCTAPTTKNATGLHETTSTNSVTQRPRRLGAHPDGHGQRGAGYLEDQ